MKVPLWKIPNWEPWHITFAENGWVKMKMNETGRQKLKSWSSLQEEKHGRWYSGLAWAGEGEPSIALYSRQMGDLHFCVPRCPLWSLENERGGRKSDESRRQKFGRILFTGTFCRGVFSPAPGIKGWTIDSSRFLAEKALVKCHDIHWNFCHSVSFELHFYFLPGCVNEMKACRSTIDGSNWFCVCAFAFSHEVEDNFSTESHVTLQWTKNREFPDLVRDKINIRVQWTLLFK